MNVVFGTGRRRWVGRICAAVLAIGLLPAAAVAQTQWKMTTEYPQSNISGIGLVTFGKLLSSKTQGALTTVTAFDNELKISAREMPQAAQDRRIDGGDAFAAPLESFDPIFGLSALPFVVQSTRPPRPSTPKRGRSMSGRWRHAA